MYVCDNRHHRKSCTLKKALWNKFFSFKSVRMLLLFFLFYFYRLLMSTEDGNKCVSRTDFLFLRIQTTFGRCSEHQVNEKSMFLSILLKFLQSSLDGFRCVSSSSFDLLLLLVLLRPQLVCRCRWCVCQGICNIVVTFRSNSKIHLATVIASRIDVHTCLRVWLVAFAAIDAATASKKITLAHFRKESAQRENNFFLHLRSLLFGCCFRFAYGRILVSAQFIKLSEIPCAYLFLFILVTFTVLE